MPKTNVKKDDYVMIIAGKDKGKTAQVIAVNRDTNRVLIEGKNLSTVNKKAVKARKANDPSGHIEQPGSVDISNVMPVCAACGKPTRVGYRVEEDGKRVRICKKCGAVLTTKKPAAAKAAKASVRRRSKAAEAPAETSEAPKAE